jgi:hypothetical protein
MDQRSIILFLARKSLSFRDIHDELVVVLGPDAIDDSTVTKYLRQSRLTAIILDTLEPPSLTVTNDEILDAFQLQPFFSVRELAKLTCIPRSPVHQYRPQTLRFVVKHLRWVPHSLTAAQKVSRVTPANQLFQDLCSSKHRE